jgi:hypothetical protein
MPDGFTKKIVVIKDIASNYIEEAIIILKNYPGECSCGSNKGRTVKNRKVVDDFILHEAEMVINNYIKNNNIQQVYNGQANRKTGSARKVFRENLIINLALVGSIALFVFLITRFF